MIILPFDCPPHPCDTAVIGHWCGRASGRNGSQATAYEKVFPYYMLPGRHRLGALMDFFLRPVIYTPVSATMTISQMVIYFCCKRVRPSGAVLRQNRIILGRNITEDNGKLPMTGNCREVKRLVKGGESRGAGGELRGIRDKEFHCQRHELRTPGDIRLSEDAA